MTNLYILYLWVVLFKDYRVSAGMGRSDTTLPDKHGRVFLVPCKKLLVYCTLLAYCTRIHRTSHFLQGTRNTRPCITGHPVVQHVVLEQICTRLVLPQNKKNGDAECQL